MAIYKLTLEVEGKRRESVEKKLRKYFGGDELDIVSVEKRVTAKSRAERLTAAQGQFENAKSEVEELHSEMESWYENIPENFQNGDKGEQVQSAVDALQEIIDNMDSVDFDGVKFPGMFG